MLGIEPAWLQAPCSTVSSTVVQCLAHLAPCLWFVPWAFAWRTSWLSPLTNLTDLGLSLQWPLDFLAFQNLVNTWFLSYAPITGAPDPVAGPSATPCPIPSTGLALTGCRSLWGSFHRAQLSLLDIDHYAQATLCPVA